MIAGEMSDEYVTCKALKYSFKNMLALAETTRKGLGLG